MSKTYLDQLESSICGSSCCIAVWGPNNAPSSVYSVLPCSNVVLYCSSDVTIAGCNVFIPTPTTPPMFVSQSCAQNIVTFTGVSPQSTCNGNNDVCTVSGSNAPSLNIGISNGCADVSECDCNAGPPSCQISTSALETNYVLNPSFEDGLSDWILSPVGSDFSSASDNTVHTGSYAAQLGPIDNPSTLCQSFSIFPGLNLQFSFWLYCTGYAPGSFSASWGSTVVYQTDIATNGCTNSWVQHTFSVTSTGTDSITFSFTDNPSYYYLDDVVLAVEA